MVRTSRALVVGTIFTFFVAIIAFIGGWTTSRAVGDAALGTFITALAHRDGEAGTPTEVRDQFAIFWDVWSLVNAEFYHPDPLDEQQMVYGAIRGMLQSLGDDYTSFQEPEVAEQNRESMEGKFEGIGAYLQIVEGEVRIERPIKNSPAMKAGLQDGDVIVQVDGTELAPLIAGLDDAEAAALAAKQIRGPKGSVVRLTIRRPPETSTFDVDITRDEVPLISVNAQMLASNVGYIQITEFKATTTDEFDEALRELLPQQPDSLILDLRNNPGGFLTTAQEVLGRFYEGTALYEEDSDGNLKELRTIKGPRDTRVYEMPVVVLVNGGSASAAEIVAGALRDRRPQTTLFGETSFGKGSVQNIHHLRDGSSVRITIAQWLTPEQHEIHQVGITPDHIVTFSQESEHAVVCIGEQQPPEGQDTCSDAQLSWALRFLTTQATPPPPEPTPTGWLEVVPVG